VKNCVLFYCTDVLLPHGNRRTLTMNRRLEQLVSKFACKCNLHRYAGALKLTPMVLCMALIEVTDVAFCIDGVSTIFMVGGLHELLN
jgi:predicted tellurium resistance membrane protein TerC